NAGTAITLSIGGTAAEGVNSSYSGALSGTGSSIVKTGSGTLTLSGADTYTGTTTVNAGTLLVNGTHTGGGAYTVNSGGTLGGTGTISEAISVAGTGVLQSGASIGTLHTTGAVSFAAATGILRTQLFHSQSSVLDFGSTGTLNMTSTHPVPNFTLLGNLTSTQFIFGQYSGTNVTGTF